MTGGVKEIAMAHEVYYEFHQDLEQLRRHGARGGKATAHHRRERLEGAAAVAPERERAAAPQVGRSGCLNRDRDRAPRFGVNLAQVERRGSDLTPVFIGGPKL